MLYNVQMSDVEIQQINEMLNLAVKKKGLPVAHVALMLQARLQQAQMIMPPPTVAAQPGETKSDTAADPEAEPAIEDKA